MEVSIIRIAILLLFPMTVFTQGGIQFYGGIQYAQNRSELITPESTSHPGYFYGMDIRLNDGKMFFGGGLEMGKTEFMAQSEKSYFSQKNSMNWLKVRFGLGYRIFAIGKDISGRLKTYASINMITSHPEDMIEAPYSNYNSGVAAATLGFGIDIAFITFDIEYERGFFNAVNLVSGTEFDFYKLSTGFRF